MRCTEYVIIGLSRFAFNLLVLGIHAGNLFWIDNIFYNFQTISILAQFPVPAPEWLRAGGVGRVGLGNTPLKSEINSNDRSDGVKVWLENWRWSSTYFMFDSSRVGHC